MFDAAIDVRINCPRERVLDVGRFTALTEQVGVPGGSVKTLVIFRYLGRYDFDLSPR